MQVDQYRSRVARPLLAGAIDPDPDIARIGGDASLVDKGHGRPAFPPRPAYRLGNAPRFGERQLAERRIPGKSRLHFRYERPDLGIERLFGSGIALHRTVSPSLLRVRRRSCKA